MRFPFGIPYRLLALTALAVSAPLAVLAAYDVTGNSAPENFVPGVRSPTTTHTAAPATRTPSPADPASSTPTATWTATPQPCGRVHDASLSFVDTDIRVAGGGPFDVTLELRNTGRQSAAVDVVLRLETLKGTHYLDEVRLPVGTWTIAGAPSSTLYAAGTIEPLRTIQIPLSVTLTEAWDNAPGAAEAKLRAGVASASCLRHASSARSTITFRRESDGDTDRAASDATTADHPQRTASDEGPAATATETALATPTTPTSGTEVTPTPLAPVGADGSP